MVALQLLLAGRGGAAPGGSSMRKFSRAPQAESLWRSAKSGSADEEKHGDPGRDHRKAGYMQDHGGPRRRLQGGGLRRPLRTSDIAVHDGLLIEVAMGFQIAGQPNAHQE